MNGAPGASNVGRNQQTTPPHHNKRKTVPGMDDNDAERHGTYPHAYEHQGGVYREGAREEGDGTRAPVPHH